MVGEDRSSKAGRVSGSPRLGSGASPPAPDRFQNLLKTQWKISGFDDFNGKFYNLFKVFKSEKKIIGNL